MHRASAENGDDHGLAAPASRLGVGGHPEVDDATLDRHARRLLRRPSRSRGRKRRVPRGMSAGSTATTPFRTGRPLAVRPGRWYATASTRSLYDGGSAPPAGSDARSENAAQDHSEKRSPPSCSPEHEARTLTDLVRHGIVRLWKVSLCRVFGFVAGCRHPEGVLVSPTCDGQDRHRRVRPESRQAGTWGLDNRMGAENRPPRGLRRGAAACRRIGFCGPRYSGQAGPGAGDHRRARGARHEPRRVDRGIQRRERRARPDRRRARDERTAPRRRAQEPERRAAPHRRAPPRSVRQRRRRLDARGAARRSSSLDDIIARLDAIERVSSQDTRILAEVKRVPQGR